MFSLSFTGPGRRFLLGAVAPALLAAVVSAIPETLTLSAGTSQEVEHLDASAGDPETDWNCLEIVVGEQSLSVIMPRFIPPGLDFTGDVLELARRLVPETVLASTGDIGAQHQAGTIFGVEYKVFTDDPNDVPEWPFRLDITGTLLSDSGETIGTMYCFNEGQFTARAASLANPDPIPRFTLWCGPLGHGNAIDDKSVMVTGNDNSFHGSLKSNGAFRVIGDDHTFEGQMVYRTDIVVQMGSHTLGPQVQQPDYPVAATAHEASWYQANADHSFSGDISLLNDGFGGLVTPLGAPVSGLVYATGSISIEGNDIDAEATFVAENGVEFIGNQCVLRPAVDELLAYSLGTRAGEGVSIPGSNLILTGSLVAPQLRVNVSGSNNQIFGRLGADQLRILGMSNSLSNVYEH